MTSLGTFSMSLNVKDIAQSRAFYEKLGFEVFDGSQTDGWLMLRSGDIKLGLFQGQIPANTLTFYLPDVRAVQRELKAGGIALDAEADETTTGPAHAMLTDPDGNAILLDQFTEYGAAR